MRIRRLLDRSRAVPAARPLELYAHPGQVLTPGRAAEITLDLAVVVETGQAVLVLGTAALAAAGISAHPTLRTTHDPVGPLTLLATAPGPVAVPADVPVAIGLVLDAPAETFYEDASIDARMTPGGLRFTDLER
jgi:hypothetical protein